MLHGTGAINGNTIFVWTARRLQHPPALVNEYEVSCEYEDRKGIIHTFEGKLTHTYEHGAITLAKLVLEWAENELLKEPDEVPETGEIIGRPAL